MSCGLRYTFLLGSRNFTLDAEKRVDQSSTQSDFPEKIAGTQKKSKLGKILRPEGILTTLKLFRKVHTLKRKISLLMQEKMM